MTTTPAIWTAMESNNSVTENGATTHSTSSNSLTDLFFKVGGMRAATEEDIVDTFIKAYCEFPHEAMKCLFYARDIRGGQGERRFFKTCIASLGKSLGSSNHLEKNLHLIPEYGRSVTLRRLLALPFRVRLLRFGQTLFSTRTHLLASGLLVRRVLSGALLRFFATTLA